MFVHNVHTTIPTCSKICGSQCGLELVSHPNFYPNTFTNPNDKSHCKSGNKRCSSYHYNVRAPPLLHSPCCSSWCPTTQSFSLTVRTQFRAFVSLKASSSGTRTIYFLLNLLLTFEQTHWTISLEPHIQQ